MNLVTNRDPVRRSRQDRQSKIFDAAMTLFAHRGYDAVSVEEICVAGGIGRATFFRLFGGKSGLIEEANRRTADRVRQSVSLTGARGPDALGVMGGVISSAWLSAGTPIYAMFETVMGSSAAGVRPSAADAAREGSGGLAGLAIDYVAQGQIDGIFHPDLDPEAMGMSFMSLLLVACSLWVSRDGRRAQAFPVRVDQAVSVMIKGLKKTSVSAAG